MKVIDLLCDQGHRFEGWFASGEAFRDQSERHLVLCPQCQSSTVSQLPSAPHVRRSGTAMVTTGKGETVTQGNAGLAAIGNAVAHMQASLLEMARKAENVGARFPEEARRIHYDEAPARTIRGIASADETRDLLEEGILVLPAPVPPDDEFH